MCRRVTCASCGRPTYSGCGAHIEQVLADVPPAERCQCPRVAGQGGVRSLVGVGLALLRRLVGG